MKKPIKILRTQSRIVVGGPAIHTLLLTRNLNDDEFQTILVGGASAKDEKSVLDDVEKTGIDFHVINEMGREIHFYDDLISFIKLFKLIRHYKPDIVHTHTAKAGAIGRVAAYLAGVQYIFHTFHGHIFEGYFGNFKSKFFIMLERILARITTKIITISEQQKYDILYKYKITDDAKIELIPLGFEWDKFFKSNISHSLRKKYDINQDKFLIGIIGRIVPIKNHRLFLDIAFQLIDIDPNSFHFVIIGDGELRSGLEDKISDNHLMEYFTFTGWLPLNAQIYRELDLVLLTSKNEGTPVTLIEALVAGVPIVSSAVGGVSDIFKFYESEYLIASDNPQHYTEKILKIFKEKIKINVAISLEVKHFFNSERLCSDIRSLYRRVINESF